MLYILAGGEPCEQSAAAATGLSAGDAGDAFIYWVQAGVLLKQDDTAGQAAEAGKAASAPEVFAKAKQPSGKSTAQAGAVRPLPAKYPTHSEIARRAEQSPEIAYIMRQAQLVLGSAFGYDTQALLLMMHDHYGFPPDVVLMLIEHAKLTKRTGGAALKKLAQDWASAGVTVLADAERETEIWETSSRVYSALAAYFGFEKQAPSDLQRSKLRSWLYTFGFGEDVITYALECVREQGAAGSFPAAGKLLAKWHTKGYKELEQVRHYTTAAARGKKEQTLRERTYDLTLSGRERYYEELRRKQALEGGSE